MGSNLDSLSDVQKHTYMVGMISQQWALIEGSLDFSAFVVFHSFGGKSTASELPRALDRKVKWLRKSIATSPQTASFSEHSTDLLNAVSEAKQFRHDCVHGITLRDQGGKFPLPISILDRHPETFSERSRTISEDDMVAALRETHFLNIGTYGLLLRLLHQRSGDAPCQLHNELPLLLDQPPPSTLREKRIARAALALLNP